MTMVGKSSKISVAVSGCVSIGFGLWHFFVPAIWNWYSYIDVQATELVIAVRAINVFFSLCLVLFGSMNILLIFDGKASRFSLMVVLGATCSLWTVRVIMQLIFPQGSAVPALQYGMLITFVAVLAGYAVALIQVARSPARGGGN
jgi:hypothetical protein